MHRDRAARFGSYGPSVGSVSRTRLHLGAALTLALAVGCSAGSGEDGAGVTSTSSGFTTSSGSGGAGGEGIGGGCASIAQAAESYPVNLYVMLDRSQSMTGNPWNVAVEGLTAFAEDDASAGLRVALRSFPEGAAGCDQNFYKDPAVGWGELPALSSAFVAELASYAPDGFSTPTYQALGGALLECVDVVDAAPDQRAAVLLITDGAPQGPSNTTCAGQNPESHEVIANLAKAAYDGFGVRTFVIGFPGVDASFANLVAASGGTNAAIVLGTTNVASQFSAALQSVRGSALPCEYKIPPEVFEGDLTLGEVNVELTLGGAEPVLIPKNDACDGAGWRYVGPVLEPEYIELCPASCAAVQADFEASIRIVLGCLTIVK
jgi:hypothetical protein